MKRRSGFTLIEVLIASVVFVLVLAGTLPLVVMSINTGRNSYDLSRATDAVTMVMDRVVTARKVGAKLPGPGGNPADVSEAPETGERCYFLASDDHRAPEIANCTELEANGLVSRQDLDDRYAVQWVTKRETALPGAPAIDNLTVTVSWKKGANGRIRRVSGVVRVPR